MFKRRTTNAVTGNETAFAYFATGRNRWLQWTIYKQVLLIQNLKLKATQHGTEIQYRWSTDGGSTWTELINVYCFMCKCLNISRYMFKRYLFRKQTPTITLSSGSDKLQSQYFSKLNTQLIMDQIGTT